MENDINSLHLSCPQCTFRNHVDLFHCELCEAALTDAITVVEVPSRDFQKRKNDVIDEGVFKRSRNVRDDVEPPKSIEHSRTVQPKPMVLPVGLVCVPNPLAKPPKSHNMKNRQLAWEKAFASFCTGKTATEIAAENSIQFNTVLGYLLDALKFGCRMDLLALCQEARRHGLGPPNSVQYAALTAAARTFPPMAHLTAAEVVQKVAHIPKVIPFSDEERTVKRTWYNFYKWWETFQQTRFEPEFSSADETLRHVPAPRTPLPLPTASRSTLRPYVTPDVPPATANMPLTATLEGLPRVREATTIAELEEECVVRGMPRYSFSSSATKCDYQRHVLLGSVLLSAIPRVKYVKSVLSDNEKDREVNHLTVSSLHIICQRRGLSKKGTSMELKRRIVQTLDEEVAELRRTADFKYTTEVEKLAADERQLRSVEFKALTDEAKRRMDGKKVHRLHVLEDRRAAEIEAQEDKHLIATCFHDCPMALTKELNRNRRPRLAFAKCQWNDCWALPCALSCDRCDWDVCEKCAQKAARLNKDRRPGEQVIRNRVRPVYVQHVE